MNWNTRITHVDVDTGEVLDVHVLHKYILKKQETKTTTNQTTNNGTKHITKLWQRSNQLSIFGNNTN